MAKGKSSAAENIRVVVRVRDRKDDEIKRGDKVAVTVDIATQQVLVKDEAQIEAQKWAFDAVYNNTYTQKDIFTKEVRPLVDFVMDGYNATCFAYGQSGSGKTFTMTGDVESGDPAKYGMMPQAVDYLFAEIKKNTSSTKQFKVKVSYIELYNGRTRDLLSNKEDNLEIREGPSGFYVKGAEIKEVRDFKACMHEFDEGTERRRVAETNLNSASSRSHALFSLIVEQFDYELDAQAPVTSQSKLIIVDLAGSEKLGKTGAQGETMVEGCNINASLSALGTCIDKIVTSGPKAHIPYRANPLTRLLKDSLGGNAKTVMFANVGPSHLNTSETKSTLRFADNAKRIQNKPIKNIDPLKLQIMELQEQIAELKKRLGGEWDPEHEKKQQDKIDQLELENASMKESMARMNAGSAGDQKQMEEELNALKAQLAKKEHELVEACREQEEIRTRLTNDLQHAQNLRSIAMTFLRRVMTEQQINMINERMPASVPRSDGKGDWTVGEISQYFDGFSMMFEESRKTSYNEEDLHREIQRAKSDVEGRFQNQIQVLEAERDQLIKQRDETRKDQESAAEATSQLRVEITQLRDESSKLREKIERDQEKFKKKMEKSKEEQSALQSQLDQAKNDLETSAREIEKLKKDLENGGGFGLAGSGSMSGAPLSKDERVAKLQTELEDALNAKKAADLRIRQMLVQTRRGAVFGGLNNGLPSADGSAPPPPPPEDGDDENGTDAFAITETDKAIIPDSDTLGILQQQLRVQHRLQELNHNHQKKLDLLLRKYEMVRTGNVTKLDAAADSVSAEALQAKQIELDTLRSEMDKKLEKLTGKLNKTVAAYEAQIRALQEEKQQLEEERLEANAHTEDVGKFNQQLAVEVETLRARLANHEKEAASDNNMLRSENDTLKNMVARLEHEIDSNRGKVQELNELHMDYKKLHSLYEHTEKQLREKMVDLENQYQTTQWSNKLVEEERMKYQDAEIRIANLQHEKMTMEEQYEQSRRELELNMFARQKAELQEQEERFLEMIEEEKYKVKQAKNKLRIAKENEARAEKKYDEMVLENSELRTMVEEEKKQAQMAVMQSRGASDRAVVDSYGSSISASIRNSNQSKKALF